MIDALSALPATSSVRSEGGKGTMHRPADTDKFNDNWDLIWGKKDTPIVPKDPK